jgi:adenosine deaminase
MHCDVDQENSVEHIRQCLEVIGVDRIDHGVNILESEELTAELRRRGLGLTVCPISNRWCTGDLKAAQVKQMLDLGIRVTVNSDDPAYFAGYVTDNLIAAQQAAGLAAADLLQLQRNAIEIAWLPARTRDQLLAEIDQYAASARDPAGT